MGRGAAEGECLAVEQGRVPFVFVPSVLGKLIMQLHHIVVAEGFGKYRCGGNGSQEVISLDNAVVRDVFVRYKAVSVNQQEVGHGGKLLNGSVHGKESCPEDVEPVDFCG